MAFDNAEFNVVEVRQALLSDYFNVTTLVGDLRESMQELSRDTSPLDSSKFTFGLADLDVRIGTVLNEYARLKDIDLSGLLIRGKSHVIHAL